MTRLVVLACLALAAAPAVAQAPPEFFTTPLSIEEMADKQAVVETDAGVFILDLLPAVAPNHVGYFIKMAQEGAYDGTTFHLVVKYGIIQGGDPLTKDPGQRDLYGTGGLGRLRAEINAERHTRGAVAAVLVPGQPDSAGSQFFICVTDQPALDGHHTIFARIVDGIAVVQTISEAPVDADGKTVDRVEIRSVTIRDAPPPEPVPFATETVEELAGYRAVLETSMGEIAIDLRPDLAPEHVRNFLRLATVGVYDGTSVHRVVPGFVIQTGFLPTRAEPLRESQQRHVTTLQPEFTPTPHVKGTVSMARGDDPASASTSFFICTAPAPALDGTYTVFGEVAAGLAVVEAIEAVPTEGETPRERIELSRVRIERRE